jgi:hypothetical protein
MGILLRRYAAPELRYPRKQGGVILGLARCDMRSQMEATRQEGNREQKGREGWRGEWRVERGKGKGEVREGGMVSQEEGIGRSSAC